MALGTIAAAVLPSVVSAVASAGASKLIGNMFGGGANASIDALGKPQLTPFSAGGLTARLKNGAINITADPARTALIGKLAATFPQQAAALAALRGQVVPGFGRLTAARVLGVQNARRQAVGDLRENLQRRRILGSSFAQDALARANLAFGQQEAQVRAESFLQELDLTHQLLGQEFEAARGETTTLINELNLQSDAALKLATGAQAEAGASARQQAVLASQSLQGLGAAFQPAIDAIGSGVGKAVAGLFPGAPAA